VNRGFDFNFSGDWQNLKSNFKNDGGELFDSEAIESLKSSFNALKGKINDQEAENNVIDADLITQKVLEKISQIKNIVYEYEPWNIKFDYPENMSKQIDLTEQKINLYYKDVQNLGVVIKRRVLESSFNDWLNHNYDLQKLEKQEYNNLIFWVQDLSDAEYLKKEYYVNSGKEVFTIIIESARDQEQHWDYLENIVKSFKQVNL